MTPELEATLHRLREAGCTFPISRDELHEHRVYDMRLLREMAREGLVQNRELYDSTLTESCLRVLESFGIESREHFRRLFREGELDLARLSKMRLMGRHNITQILKWAGLPPPESNINVSLQLSAAACEGLQRLKKHLDLPSRDLVLECLIADAVHDIDGAEENPKA